MLLYRGSMRQPRDRVRSISRSPIQDYLDREYEQEEDGEDTKANVKVEAKQEEDGEDTKASVKVKVKQEAIKPKRAGKRKPYNATGIQAKLYLT